MKTPRANFGQFTFDAYNPSNIEIMFEFLNRLDEVRLPDNKLYRMKNGVLEVYEEQWELCTSSVHYFLNIVKDMTSEDWGEVRRHSKKHNLLDFNPIFPRRLSN